MCFSLGLLKLFVFLYYCGWALFLYCHKKAINFCMFTLYLFPYWTLRSFSFYIDSLGNIGLKKIIPAANNEYRYFVSVSIQSQI